MRFHFIRTDRPNAMFLLLRTDHGAAIMEERKDSIGYIWSMV